MSKAIAVKLLAILDKDREERLLKIDRYIHGKHDDPYIPDNADTEYKLLAKRARSNWMPLVMSAPGQALYVDGFRRGRATEGGAARDVSPLDDEWTHWQNSRLDSRQSAIHNGALGYGHSFSLTERKPGSKRSTTIGLSALLTSALFEDPANDLVPEAALTIKRWATSEERGLARMWIGPQEYAVTFKSLTDAESVTVVKGRRHKVTTCPVTRFTASVDLEGRTMGVVEPMIPLQDRINQTVFDLLVAQTYGSFQVRTVTGMAPPLRMKAVLDELTGEPTGDFVYELDSNGRPIPENVRVNASRFMFAESEKAEFGSLPHTPLGGYIDSIDMSIRHLAAISQTPPHHLLGQIANLSAEALQAAEQSLARKVESFRKSFGESWERVFQLAAELEGNTAAAEDIHGEVLWRDVESRSLAATSDALLKLKDLGIPVKGLWRRVPGTTQQELAYWDEEFERQPELVVSDRLSTSTGLAAGTRQAPRLLRDEAA